MERGAEPLTPLPSEPTLFPSTARPEPTPRSPQPWSEPASGRESARPADHRDTLRATIELAPIGFAHFDAGGRFLFANDRLCELLGYSRDELLARTFLDVSHPDDLPECLGLMRKLAAGTIPHFNYQKRFIRRDGGTPWMRVTVWAVRAAAGELDFFIGTAEDITEQIAGEAVHRATEERLRAALQASGTGTYRWEIQTNLVGFDENLDRLFGLPPGETVRSLNDFLMRVHPDDRARVIEGCLLSAEEGVDFAEEFRVVWPDGTVRWLADKGRTIAADDGTPLFMTGACTDVTRRRETEEALRSEAAKLRRITESGIVGVMYWTADGRIIDANAEACRMLGWTRADLDAGVVNWRALTPTEWHAVDDAKVEELMRRGVVAPFEKEFWAADGRRVPVLLAAATIEGQADRGVAVCVDISARRAAELERERLLALERQARSDAERAARVRDEVLGIVAHDLRNPVHTIMMSTQLLLEVPLTEAQRQRHLAGMERSAKVMNLLIRDLLEATRAESGGFTVEHERLSVRPLLEIVLELFEPTARARAVSLTVEVEPGTPAVLGDGERLIQVLSNLVENALKFTPDGGRVRVHARRADEFVRISVEDTGVGIPAAHLPHVFDRFWQADRASRAGAGLGLAICKGIVDAHGGRIWVESTPGSGATFHFTLPVAPG